MKKIAIGIGGFVAGIVMTAGVTMAATTVVKATKGTATLQLNGSKVSSGTDLSYGGTTYLSLGSVESVLKRAGLGYKWSGNTLNVTTPKSQSSPITFSNIIVKSDGFGDTIVDGEATNHDTKTHDFTLVVSFYDSNGKLLGTADGAVNELAGGDTKTFEAMATSDYISAASYKVQVDALVD
ncbi:FxLYD domain-containing protein [Alicyclobacillus fastidiosus]|uniref:FxLYD domain-containing protein n=1 Tax=Alicyclobacillus fastidiosus TaxID=392011 RepID=A0ABV5AIC9_9BACL|nr:FxLYD domain-containing protein [Alicyclobacillus fastidiosus]WEH11143.1 FxLYD domain-containing protein [Alicyclobacillus fastidiosus]